MHNPNLSGLELFVKDGIELVIDTQTGEVYYPGYRSLARVCSLKLERKITDVQVKRIVVKAIEGATDLSLKNSQIQTQGGLQGATLIPRRLGTKVIKKYNPDLYEEMAEAGHLVFLHQLAGFKIESKPVEQPKSVAEIILAQAQLLVDLERKQKELEARQIETESKVKEIEQRAKEAEKSFKALPAAKCDCPARTTRNEINKAVRGFAFSTGANYRETWNHLYREFRDRHHVDLKIRAANGNCKPLDVAEALEVLDELYSTALEIFPQA